jgi:hypothetical protein
MVGSRFEIASAPGQDTTVTAEIPFDKDVQLLMYAFEIKL